MLKLVGRLAGGDDAERRPQGGSWGSSQPRSGGPGLFLLLQIPNRWVPAPGLAALRPRGALPARLARLHRRPRLSCQLRPARQRRAPVGDTRGSGCCPGWVWGGRATPTPACPEPWGFGSGKDLWEAVPSRLLAFRSLGGVSSAKLRAGSHLWSAQGLVWGAWISLVCCSGVLWVLAASISVPTPH